MPSSIVSPFPVFNDLDGTPLEAGYIYIGQSNLNPEVAPINVFWDSARTIPAAQPIRTVAGYPSRNGSPGNIYVSADTYSITVRNRNRVFVFAAFDQSDAPTSVFDISTQVITATAGQTAFTLTTFTYLPGTDTLQVYRNGLRLINVVDYLETNSSTVTMVAASAAGDEFLFQGGSVVTGDQVLGSQVSFVQAGTGAVTRNMQDKARESVSVLDFGAVGDGIADDTAAIQAAVDSFGAAGGTVMLSNNGKYKVLSNLTVKSKVFLVGQAQMPGRSTTGSGASTDYAAMGSCIRLDSTATITLQGGAGLAKLMIYRNGMTFPAAGAGSFAGTAVTITGDDASVKSCFIMGFNKAVYASGCERQQIESLYHDNNNGIEITNCLDVAYISNCHAWPFSSIISGGTWQNNTRTGKAYWLHDTVDWAKLTNCFSYGYATGFLIDNSNSVTLVSCGADAPFGPAPLFDCTGFSIVNSSQETKLIACQAAAQTQAVFLGTLAGQQTLIDSFTAWHCLSHAILINAGNCSIIGGLIRNIPNGITVANSSSVVVVEAVAFKDIATNPVTINTATSSVFVSNCDFYNFQGQAVSLALKSPTIPSADPLVIPINGDIFNVSGTTGFGRLEYGWMGRVVTLIFTGSLSVYSSTGTDGKAIKLNSGSTFNSVSNSTLTLKNNGNQWFEIGRSI